MAAEHAVRRAAYNVLLYRKWAVLAITVTREACRASYCANLEQNKPGKLRPVCNVLHAWYRLVGAVNKMTQPPDMHHR